jgi:UDP-3-O-[3-hydroxymyristoyl] N-acetylglucosamine deacetylase/3-hydroxyacyl-[acyl-carrier-protein] dehydratase
MTYRKTIQKPIELSGVGLHSGKPGRIILQPAEPNFGIRFQLLQLEGDAEFPADIRFVSSTNRGTSLSFQDGSVRTVEHVMSALYGLGIDDVLIQVEGVEIPILDGSAKPFVDALLEAGIQESQVEREYLVVDEVIEFSHAETGSEYILMPSDRFELQTLIDFKSPYVDKQFAEMNGDIDYAGEIAPARTFGFFSEIDALLDNDLAKGGDLTNAIVVADRILSPEELRDFGKKMGVDNVVMSREGILNTTPLRFSNELARHKLMDLIGDLALLGVPIKARIIAKKPGHEANIALARHLKEVYRRQKKLKGKPRYDMTQAAVYDVNQVARLLPHRFPFLLVDKIIEMTDTYIVGIKNVTMNEPYFAGHFPENPVMPGVLQVEAMAQVGGVLALSLQEDPMGWDTYFLKLDRVKFKQKVMPGDTLVIKLELLEPIRRGIVHMWGTCYVGDAIVSEGDLTAQIVKINE